MRLIATLFLAVVLAGGISTMCEAGDINDYLDKDGKLKEKVALEIGEKVPKTESCPKYQVTVWVIEPSGAWTQEIRFSTWLTLGGGVVAKGQLTERQLAALARHLAAQEFTGLPDDAGLISDFCSSNPSWGHRLPSDSALRRTPLPSLAVRAITARRGLAPPETQHAWRTTKHGWWDLPLPTEWTAPKVPSTPASDT